MTSLDREALSFSHVTFNRDDGFGELMAWISLVPMGFFVIQFAFVIVASLSARQRKVALLILFGQLLNECLSYKLKDFFQDLRPHGTERADYGMPSSHSQYMGFLLGIFGHLLPLTIFNFLSRPLSYLLALGGTGLVCYSRVHLKYHDTRQVLVGLFLGFGLGRLWSNLINTLLKNEKPNNNNRAA